jgi:HK97 family phage major capsid protein
MNKIAELKKAAADILVAMRGMLDKATAEKRELTAEEQAQYEKMEATFDAKRAEAAREERLAAVEAEVSRSAVPPVHADEQGGAPEKRKAAEYRNAFIRLLRGDLGHSEIRALQADSGASGGYLQVPQEMAAGIIQAMDNALWIRRLATKHSLVRAASLGMASLDSDPADADWTTELGTGGEDSTMSFGKREFKPNPVAKRLKVSNKLLRLVPDVEALVRERLAYKFGVTQEKAFMVGTGADDGIGTGRDVSAGNSATAVTFDGLINALYSLKQQYWARAAWVFHRDCAKMIRKLKDGNGQYIWEQAVVAGQPDRLLGLPFNMSEYAPNTFTTGLYVGVVGDFSFYHIVDALDMQIQALVELYAATNQTGFIGRQESDGMPVLAEAFARVKLG